MTDTKRVYATVEGAKQLMARLAELGIVAKITVNADGRFDVEPADGKHVCHWPGCGKEVPPAMWGCKGHWFALPKHLRDRILATYRRGQEITKTPSPEYIEAALEVQAWITQYRQQRGAMKPAKDAPVMSQTSFPHDGDGREVEA